MKYVDNSFRTREALSFRAVARSTTIMLTVLALPAFAQETKTWDAGDGGAGTPLGADGSWIQGGATNLWQDLPNNLPDESFDSGDNAVFSAPGGYTVDLGGNVRANNVTIDQDGVEISDADNADTFRVTGNIDVSNAGQSAEISADIASAATATGAGDLNLTGDVNGAVTNSGTGTVTVSGTAGKVNSNSGTTTVAASSVVSGALEVDGGTANVEGTVQGNSKVSAGTLNVTGDLDGDLTNRNGATTNLAASGDIAGDVTNLGDLNVNGGSMNKLTNRAAGDADFAGGKVDTDITNAGTLDVNSGLVRVTGNSTTNQNGGTLTVANGAKFKSDTTNQNGAVLNLNGILNGDLTNQSGGQANIAATGDVKGDVTNAGDLNVSGGSMDKLTNSATGDADFTNGGKVDTDVTNAGALNVNSGTLTVTGNSTVNQNGGSLTIANGATLDSNTTNQNGGTLNVTGTLDGNLTNQNGGTTNLAATGDITGAVGNAGDLNINGGSMDKLFNTATGDVDVTGGGTVDTTIANAGSLEIKSGTLAVNGTGTTNQNGGNLVVTGGATLDSNAVNQNGGTLTVQGTLDGNLSNLNGGRAVVSSAGDVTGNVTNAGDLNINGGSVNGLTNASGANVDFNGGTVDTTITNAGAMTITPGNTVKVTGNSTTNQNGGNFRVTESATLESDLVNQNGGSMFMRGTLIGDLTNEAGGNLLSSGTVSGNVTNSGTMAINPDGLNVVDPAGPPMDGNFTQTSGGTTTLSMGVPSINAETSKIDGTATLDGTFIFTGDRRVDNATNIDFTDIAMLSADTLENQTGSTNVALGKIAQQAVEDSVDGMLTLFSADTTNNLSLGTLDYDENSGFDLFLENIGNDTVVSSRVNGAIAGAAATVGLTQSLIDVIVNRPTSPYVVGYFGDKVEHPCGPGAWARVTGGKADTDGRYTDLRSGSSSTAPVSLDYYGFQFGGDFACFDDRFNGWDMAFGVIGGLNSGTSTLEIQNVGISGGPNRLTDTDFDQTYFGVYMVAVRGQFSVDLQYRYEDTDFSTSSTNVGGGVPTNFLAQEYDNKGHTLSGAVSYSIPIPSVENLAFTPTAGFLFSNQETSRVNFVDSTGQSNGHLDMEDGETRVGFIGASLSRAFVNPSNNSATSYFGTVTFYEDFGNDRIARYTSTTDTRRRFSIEKPGAYGEISAGLNYARLLNPGSAGNVKQFNAGVRLDARFGESLDSYGITAQMRLQF
ncbi:MAG: hypothetical protein GJ676_08760 [Rhodobacteraceae bacterium]|nr:hypothetical protein [Paracoccaceae bacterium]